mgnify:FL=1
MSEKFQRNVENFICENCTKQVTGNGYTNHCPNCLYSKHVDENPGDRKMLDKCGGLMEPIDVFIKNDRYQIKQKCSKCSFEMTVRVQDDDNVSDFIDKLKETKPFEFPSKE